MARIVPIGGGDPIAVPDDTATRLVGSGEYEYASGETATTQGAARAMEIPAEQLASSAEPQELIEAKRERESDARIDRVYSTPIETIKNVSENVAGGATLGGSTALLRAIYGDDYAKEASRRRQARPTTALASEIAGSATGMLAGSGAGALARVLPAARVDAFAAGAGRALGGGIIGTGARFGAEGIIYGAGAGIHEVAQSTDPVTLERALSTVGSSALVGGATGFGIGAAGSALAKGFGRAGRAISEAKAGKAAAKGDDLIADVATYSDAGKDAYLLAQGENSGILGKERRKLGNLIERADSIEGKAAARDALVAERKVLEDIASNPGEHLAELREKDKRIMARLRQQIDDAERASEKISADIADRRSKIDALSFEAEKIDGQLMTARADLEKAAAKGKAGKVKQLEAKISKLEDAKNTGLANTARKHEAKIAELEAKQKNARIKLDEENWTDYKYNIDLGSELRDFRGGGRKAKDASLDTIKEWYEGLQADAMAPRRQAALAKLPDLIEQNRALSNAVMPQKTLVGEIASSLKNTVQSGAAQMAVGALAGGPVGVLAAAAARPVVNRIGEMLAGRLGKAAGEVADRTGAALKSALSTGASTATKTPPLASKVLAKASFAPEVRAPSKGFSRSGGKAAALVSMYQQRSEELLGHVQAGPDGRPKMKMTSRRQVARRLDGVRAVDPILADRIETLAARRVEYLAGKIPKRPDVAPPNWRPSDMQIRQFARSIAAVDDPAGVVERTADGTVTPEDAEALREVYPEQFADIQRQIIEKLPELRDKLPSRKRIALSILTGVPVDPALDPRILAQLQSSYRFEPGSAGGTQAPTPQPQFGSVSKPSPTAAQSRAGNERTR